MKIILWDLMKPSVASQHFTLNLQMIRWSSHWLLSTQRRRKQSITVKVENWASQLRLGVKKEVDELCIKNLIWICGRYIIFLANKRKSHLWQNINSLDCEPTIKVLWAYCLVVTCCLWGGDVILLAYVVTISQSELATVPLWPMRGPRLCHIVVTSVTMLAQSTICTRPSNGLSSQ